VSVGTWRRSVAALDKWVKWAVYEGLLEREPFRYVDKTVMTPHGLKRVRVNVLQEPDAQAEPLRFVAFEDYLLWRDVGLRGELPDGRPDPSWRGRNGERNAIFADLLVYTGMRLSEAACLLVPEVPPLAGTRVIGDLHLSPAVTKRRKARTVYVNRRSLQNLHHYIDIERDELVRRRQAQGVYAGVEHSIGARRTGRQAVTLHDGGRGDLRIHPIE
jgi:integrase